ncbi:MAG: D-aminoacyl-tRNA deacylase [Actinomycetota bacterium]
MRAVVQRVRSGSVSSRVTPDAEFETVGEIGVGLVVLVGITHDDGATAAVRLADKLWGLRVFDDADGVMNVATADAGGELLVVSQFTLYGDTSKGRRPSWIDAARPDVAEPLVDRIVERLRSLGATVGTGRFRTEMRVELVNDGPVTLIIET